LRITTGSRIDAVNDYATVRQHVLDETTGSKSNYDVGIDYLDRNYGSVFDGKASNGDSLKSISGIMEYDGSPRRFGQNNDFHLPCTAQNQKSITTTSLFSSPRPGFPQRILMTTQEASNPTTSYNQINADDTSNDVSEIGTSSDMTISEQPPKNSTFDYLYEFSETRKVLEEFFKCPGNDDKVPENGSDVDSIDYHYESKGNPENDFAKYIGQRLASSPFEEFSEIDSPKTNGLPNKQSIQPHETRNVDYFLDSASRSSGEVLDNEGKHLNRNDSRCFRYSPETTDYDSNCGDLDSLSGDFNVISSYPTNYAKYYTSMPILEDGLSDGHGSDGHASDTENNNPSGISVVMDMRNKPITTTETRKSTTPTKSDIIYNMENSMLRNSGNFKEDFLINENTIEDIGRYKPTETRDSQPSPNNKIFKHIDPELDSLYSINMVQLTPPPPAPAAHRKPSMVSSSPDVQAALKDIKNTLQRTKALTSTDDKKMVSDLVSSPSLCSPVWIPRHYESTVENMESEPVLTNVSGDEEEIDTDLETDRLLGGGHQRLDDHGFYDEKNWCDRKSRSLLSSSLSKFSPQLQSTANNSGSILRQGLSSLLPTTPEITANNSTTSKLLDIGGSISSPDHSEKSPDKVIEMPKNNESPSVSNVSEEDKDGEKKKKSKNKEVLIEGVLFRARYLGSTQLVCEGQPTKSTRMVQAEEAVSRIKNQDAQPNSDVDLFISTEKIMVLNTDLKEIMMDHALRTISYIADIGDLVVLMARRRFVPNEVDDGPKPNRTPKMICHVFESEEAQFIAQSIGQAFQVAYMEFLKANGIEDHSFVKEMDYQEVLNSQEIFGDELEIFAKKELQKEVVVPKAKGEILGVVIVESGWGSMLPTVVIANLLSSGAAARCGQLNIGDQIIAINGLSLVGLPLSICQNYIKNSKTQTVVKFTVVPCAPVVEVKIKRPNTKYQLGFSVQNGVICSLLRGGIAERGGVRVGHRIIEINNQSVVAVPHEKIVNLLATSVGEILMKTMPTSMFRLLTGQENPVYI
ncbi:Protein lin-10, partial [Pseudolycoriella hygida]